MQKIIVLGAGIYQLPLIKKAKAMGLSTIVVSYPGKYPGFIWADKVYIVDTTDVETILQIARAEKISGICTAGTDVALPALGKVIDTLGLPGISHAAAIVSSDKREMKKAFQDHQVRTARFDVIESLAAAQAFFAKSDTPIMLKAVDSSGSRGVVKVTRLEDIPEAFAIVRRVSKREYCLAEEFLAGVEFGAQAFVYNHVVQFILPHGDEVFSGDTGVPIGHYVPYILSPEIEADIRQQLEQCVQALGLNNCAINADFILKDHKVYVLEIGARAGATCLPELVALYYGFDYYQQIIQTALGQVPVFPIKGVQPCAAALLLSPQSGQLLSIENTNPPDSKIVDISFDYQSGDLVKQFRVGPDRIGQIIVTGQTLQEARAFLEKTKQQIKVEVQS